MVVWLFDAEASDLVPADPMIGQLAMGNWNKTDGCQTVLCQRRHLWSTIPSYKYYHTL